MLNLSPHGRVAHPLCKKKRLFQTNYDKLLAKIPIKQNPSSKIIKII